MFEQASSRAVADRLHFHCTLGFSCDWHYVPAKRGSGSVAGPGGVIQLGHEDSSCEQYLATLPDDTFDSLKLQGIWIKRNTVVMETLAQIGAIELRIIDEEGTTCARVEKPLLRASSVMAQPGLGLRSSAFLRHIGPDWVMSSADSRARIVLTEGILDEFVRGMSSDSSGKQGYFHRLLSDQGFLGQAQDEPSQGAWEFHDSLFHAATIHGSGVNGYGARGNKGPSDMVARPLNLLRDDQPMGPSELEPDAPFTEVLKNRRTTRIFSSHPLSLAKLETLLRLALRDHGPLNATGAKGKFHPYPSGGARNEIATIIAVINSGQDFLAAYDSSNNVVKLIESQQDVPGRVVEILSSACGFNTPLPSVGLLFAADYGCVAYKYQAIAYATILRNVGAIYQTVSLCAEALDIGSCCVGGGWGPIETELLAKVLAGRVLVGGMLLGLRDERGQ